jgi:hypothetical protein
VIIITGDHDPFGSRRPNYDQACALRTASRQALSGAKHLRKKRPESDQRSEEPLPTALLVLAKECIGTNWPKALRNSEIKSVPWTEARFT